jgi:Dolichyl-phosphate-mannose-protein mannosyltransferase
MMIQDRLAFPFRFGQWARVRRALVSDTALLVYLALLDFVGHMLFAGNYGYFRDELYYMADGRHLAFGYVDQPPLIGWLAALVHVVLGDSLFALHILPALLGACLVFVTGCMARELGGGRFAQCLAALSVLVAAVFLANTSIFSYDLPDGLWWALGAYVFIRLIKSNEPRYWLLFGLVAGFGLLTKLTMLFFGFALVIGLLLTPGRAFFRTRWPWLGGVIAALLFLPYVLWNLVNGWPTLQFWHNYSGLSGNGPLSFFLNQLLIITVLNVPLIIAGLLFYFRSEAGRPYRALGWAFVALYVLFTVINAKPYFLASAYPMLLAAGAVMFERVMRRRWIKRVYIVALALNGLLMAPLAMPILPPQAFARTYGVFTGLGNGGAGQHVGGVFPQYLGDRFGWEEMTATMAKVYQQLPPDEQAQACIYTANYGEASALSFFGPTYHLPPVISGHNNYYLWGPGRCTGAVLIVIGISRGYLQQGWSSVEQAAINTCTYCMAGEDNLPIYVCTQPKFSGSLAQIWYKFKYFGS